MRNRIIFLALLLLLSLANFAYAVPITVTFSANNFYILVGLTPAPTDPVTGTIVYDAADIHSPINSLISINMTIDGHAYSLGELAFSPGPAIGGSINGVISLVGNTNDFYIMWDSTTLQPTAFTYSDQSVAGIWQSTTFSEFSVTGPYAATNDSACTRFLYNNAYSCWVACDNETSFESCIAFNATSVGHFGLFIETPSEKMTCSCDNRITNSGIEFNEGHSFLCVSEGASLDGTVNRSINLDGNFYDGDVNCAFKCRLDPTCQPG